MIQFRNERRKIFYVALDRNPFAKLFKPAFSFSSHNEQLGARSRKSLLQGKLEGEDNVAVRRARRFPRGRLPTRLRLARHS